MRKTKRTRSKRVRRRTIHKIKGGWKNSNKAIVNISYDQLNALYNYLLTLTPGTPLYQETYAQYNIMHEAYRHEQARIAAQQAELLAQQQAELLAQQQAELRAPSISHNYTRHHLNVWTTPTNDNYNLGNLNDNHNGY